MNKEIERQAEFEKIMGKSDQERVVMCLWSDGKTEDDIEYFANTDSDNVIFNLLEDIKCLKEDLEQFKTPKNWTRPYNYKGELINEHALYRPKLKDT